MDNNIFSQEQIDKASPVPIYYQLFKLMEDGVRSGALKPSEVFPSEQELCKRFGVSHMTLRRAMSELAATGLVYAEKGRGTFVSKPKLENVVFEMTNISEHVKASQFRILEARIIKTDDFLSSKLSVDNNTSCLHLRSVLSIKNEICAYEKKYILYSKNKPIVENELSNPSLLNLIVVQADRFPTGSKKDVTVSLITAEESNIMAIAMGSPIFVAEQTIYDTEKKPIGWGRTVYRGDVYKFSSYAGW